MDKYILVDGEPVLEPDVLKWAAWFEGNTRVLKHTNVGEVLVSTVFLGIDHDWGNPMVKDPNARRKPLLWETMVFGGDHDGFQERHRSADEAVAAHELAVAMVKGVTG